MVPAGVKRVLDQFQYVQFKCLITVLELTKRQKTNEKINTCKNSMADKETHLLCTSNINVQAGEREQLLTTIFANTCDKNGKYF